MFSLLQIEVSFIITDLGKFLLLKTNVSLLQVRESFHHYKFGYACNKLWSVFITANRGKFITNWSKCSFLQIGVSLLQIRFGITNRDIIITNH